MHRTCWMWSLSYACDAFRQQQHSASNDGVSVAFVWLAFALDRCTVPVLVHCPFHFDKWALLSACADALYDSFPRHYVAWVRVVQVLNAEMWLELQYKLEYRSRRPDCCDDLGKCSHVFGCEVMYMIAALPLVVFACPIGHFATRQSYF